MYSCLCIILATSFLVLTFSPVGYGLECYVCTNQTGNREKCLNTIKTCDYGQDMCLTEIRWGTQPYWSQGADKQFYVSKTCANNDTCERTTRKYMPYCTHIWYEDWKCAECCRGDRCNYYVILGASSIGSSLGVIIACVVAVLAAWQPRIA